MHENLPLLSQSSCSNRTRISFRHDNNGRNKLSLNNTKYQQNVLNLEPAIAKIKHSFGKITRVEIITDEKDDVTREQLKAAIRAYKLLVTDRHRIEITDKIARKVAAERPETCRLHAVETALFGSACAEAGAVWNSNT